MFLLGERKLHECIYKGILIIWIINHKGIMSTRESVAQRSDLAHLVRKSQQKQLDLSGTIIRGTLKAPNSQLVTPINTKLQRSDGCD
jgi:hypothetical protein